MWAALRSDLTELVGVVSEQTEQIREKIIDETELDDSNASEQMHNNENLIYLDTDLTGTAILSGAANNNEESNYEVTGMIQTPADEAAHRSTLESTYITPLDENIENELKFIAMFNIDEMTEEISKILEHKPVVEEHFRNLVPTNVTYEEFWRRYFYRCDDVQRIEMEWELQRELQAKKRQELMDKGRNFISGFVGSALNVVAPVVSMADEEDNDDDDKVSRPTSLSQHGESFYDEEEEEEELGWDESEEEDDDEGHDSNKTTLDTHETIVFDNNNDDASDGAKVGAANSGDDYKVQQELLAALQEEKIQLQGIITVQKKEIAELQRLGATVEKNKLDESHETETAAPPPVDDDDKEESSANVNGGEETKELKRQLEEAQARIAKLVSDEEKKSVEAASLAEVSAKHDDEIRQLRALITEKDERMNEQGTELVKLQNTIASYTQEKVKVNDSEGGLQKELTESVARCTELQAEAETAHKQMVEDRIAVQEELKQEAAKYVELQVEVETYKQTVGGEIADLKQNLVRQSSENENMMSDLKAQIQALQTNNVDLSTELEQVRGQVQDHVSTITILKEDNSVADAKVAALEAQLSASTSEKSALDAARNLDKTSIQKLSEESNTLNVTIQKLEAEVKQLKHDASVIMSPAPVLMPSSAPSSSSSAVKVEAPSVVKEIDQKDDNDSDNDDEWGDTWGEDDNLDNL